MQNTGVIWRDPQPEDDMVGSTSRVVFKSIQPDGQWLQYAPDEDSQVGLCGDTSGCTDETCAHSISSQGTKMLQDNKLSVSDLEILNKWGFIKNGKLSISPRYNYIKAGTSKSSGNYLYKPWDSARNDGMIPYDMLPFPYTLPGFTLDMYGAPSSITQEMENAASDFLKVFAVQYEIIAVDDESQKLHLQQAPLAIITGVCKPWDGSLIPACGVNDGHAMCRNGYVDKQILYSFDSYHPNQKQFAWDYPTKYAIKGVLILRSSLASLSHFFNQTLKLDDRGDEVKNLQVALFLEGVLNDPSWPTRELVQKFGGYFGSNTEEAVKRFQNKYNISQSGETDTKTNNQLNLIYNI